ncbi:MAG: alpha/beta fold hydrolase [Alphaproteobacteria bacterium]
MADAAIDATTVTRAPAARCVRASCHTLSIRETGQGTPLVLLHGIGSGSLSWAGQYDAFAARHRVIAWDMPGYGGSAPVAAAEPCAADYADALADLLDTLDIATADVFGHSLGALIAAAFAHRHAARVRSLVLGSPATGYGNESPEARAEKLRARLKPMEELGATGRAAARAVALLGADASSEALGLVRRVMEMVPADGFRRAAILSSRSDIFDHAPGIGAPTLVFCGTADQVTSTASSQRVATSIAGAAYVDLPGLGHACYVEAPAIVNALVAGFLTRHDQGA